MLAMRRYLERWGYAPYPWGLGANLGIGYQRIDYEKRMLERLENVVEKHDERATLIGWSQGGVIGGHDDIPRLSPDLVGRNHQ
jgi:hypothetical protein